MWPKHTRHPPASKQKGKCKLKRNRAQRSWKRFRLEGDSLGDQHLRGKVVSPRPYLHSEEKTPSLHTHYRGACFLPLQRGFGRALHCQPGELHKGSVSPVGVPGGGEQESEEEEEEEKEEVAGTRGRGARKSRKRKDTEPRKGKPDASTARGEPLHWARWLLPCCLLAPVPAPTSADSPHAWSSLQLHSPVPN